MIVNKYGLNKNVRSFSLGGMGCSASIIGVDLIRAIMHDSPGLILLVSTENMTQNFYRGEERSMLMQNVLFRMGCSAVLFSNNPSYRIKGSRSDARDPKTIYAKYKLLGLVRTHHGGATTVTDVYTKRLTKRAILGSSSIKAFRGVQERRCMTI